MNLVKAIYKAPVTVKQYWEGKGATVVIIRYNGKSFCGTANLSKRDEGFYSKRKISLMSVISFIKRYQVLELKLQRKQTHWALLIEI